MPAASTLTSSASMGIAKFRSGRLQISQACACRSFAKPRDWLATRKLWTRIFARTRDAAYQIIERKGATFYAVAAGLMSITQAILRDQRSVLSVSSLITDYYGLSDVCFSLPTVVSGSGVERVLRLELSQDEITKLKHSAELLRSTLHTIV